MDVHPVTTNGEEVEMTATAAGTVVGTAFARRQRWLRPGWLHADVRVDPTHRGMGIGSGLRARVEATIDPDVALFATVACDDPRSLAIARAWGLEPFQIAVSMLCDLRTSPVGPASCPGIAVRAHRSLDDVDLDALDTLMRSADTSPEVGAFMSTGLASMPDPWHPVVVVAHDATGRPIGLCLADRIDRTRWHVRFTGVIPTERGHGTGRMMKTHIHKLAGAESVKVVTTTNAYENAGVRALNASLGYVVIGARWRLRRLPTSQYTNQERH